MPERSLRERLLPILKGRVFHVTGSEAYQHIVLDGAVRPNDKGAFNTNFGFSELSYFRRRGCVSVCDFRDVTDDELEEGLRKYNCLRPVHDWSLVAYLVLGEEAQQSVITWAQAVQEDGLTIQGVPRIEGGYPGPLAVEELEEVILVEIIADPWLRSLREASQPKDGGGLE